MTHFPEEVFHLIKSFTKPDIWECEWCADEFDMSKDKPDYINGCDLSSKPCDGFEKVCQECVSSRKCSMCWELSYGWKDCEGCDERYCENCIEDIVCPNCCCEACEGLCQADVMEYCECCGVGKRNGCDENPSDESIFDGMCDECREKEE